MQILITHASVARTRAITLSGWQAAGLGVLLATALLVVSAAVYHLIFVTGAREGWPVISQVMRLVVRDEFAQRDRYMRENLDAMARKLGEMQAKMVQLEAMGDRVSGLAGLKPQDLQDIKPAAGGKAQDGKGGPAHAGSGGPFVPAAAVGIRSPADLDRMLTAMDQEADRHSDVFTLIESRLFEKRLQALMVPSTQPVDGVVGSGFGFRVDPFSGRSALHTGLDFPADTGTPIVAAAGGVVVTARPHPAYGNMVEIDHGNGLITRYGHTSRMLVHEGDLIKRGQHIADVGSTGRSTGPHLHFEVLVDGVQQDPSKFLAGQAGATVARSAR
ncbi:MAG: M23 family metallopeptidase [Aquabacterium sp.]|nr:MAG: M23 family metallopeptidase [Aquabacterium sp.]